MNFIFFKITNGHRKSTQGRRQNITCSLKFSVVGTQNVWISDDIEIEDVLYYLFLKLIVGWIYVRSFIYLKFNYIYEKIRVMLRSFHLEYSIIWKE